MKARILLIPLALGVLLYLGGCKATSPIKEQIQIVDSTSVTKTTEKVISYRDTTIYVPVPVEKYREFSKDTSKLEMVTAISRAWIENGGVMHTLESKSAPVPILLPKAIKTETTKVAEATKSKKVVTIKTTIEVNKPTKWQKFCVEVVKWEIVLLIIYALVWLVLKYNLLKNIGRRINRH